MTDMQAQLQLGQLAFGVFGLLKLMSEGTEEQEYAASESKKAQDVSTYRNQSLVAEF